MGYCRGIRDENELVIRDFDRIAALDGAGWDHNRHYYPLLQKLLPKHPGYVLDAGCGTGDLARLLAPQAEAVIGIDFSPGMLARAKVLTPPSQFPNVRYICNDLMTTGLQPAIYDAIVSVATLHHLPLRECFARFAAGLKPGGMLLVLDLYAPASPADRFMNFIAVPANYLMRLLKTGRLQEAPEYLALWREHGAHDHYSTLAEIAAAAREVFPRVVQRRLLFWRYLLIASTPGTRASSRART